MSKFSFLKEPFLRWYDEKKAQLEKFDYDKNFSEIEDYISCDKSDLDEAIDNLLYCNEFGFPPDAMKYIMERLASRYLDCFPKDVPIACDVSFEINRFPNAFAWTLVNVYELRFFDMSDIKFKIPYNQCRFCGKPDAYEHSSGIKKFNKRSKYCHHRDCDKMHIRDGSNPLNHKNCCSGKYGQDKKKLYQQMRAVKTPIERKIELFIDYCERRLKENESIEWTIQTKDKKENKVKKAICIDDLY